MAVIVVGGTKGGVGKTTVSACLAIACMQRGYRVAIVDLDPQRSFGRWHELRCANGKSEVPELLPVRKYADEMMDEAIELGTDYVIVDLPPGSIDTSEVGISYADLVVVPVRPSPIDVESMDAIAELAEEQNRPLVFVMNATKPNSKMTEGARHYLSNFGEVLKVEIGDRVAYASGFLRGLVGQEVDSKGAAVEEIATLWMEVEKRAKRSARARQRQGA